MFKKKLREFCVLFNSYSFIFIFLPLVALVYFLLHKYTSAFWARLSLMISSLVLSLSLWNVYCAAILIFSVLFNYMLGITISSAAKAGNPIRKKLVFIAAIAGNILLLGFFKYANFFLDSINTLLSAHMTLLHLIIPIGISFYTFMQIAWLTDIYRTGGFRYDFVSYCLYVTFFPSVISGPIAYHKEIIPQFESRTGRKIFHC